MDIRSFIAIYAEVKNTSENSLVYIHDPENKLWEGKAEAVREKFTALVNFSQEKGLTQNQPLKIKVAVTKFWKKGGLAESATGIIILSSFYIKDKIARDEIISHEFAHILVVGEKDDHGPRWEHVCGELLKRLEPRGKCSAILPFWIHIKLLLFSESYRPEGLFFCAEVDPAVEKYKL